MDRAHRIGQTKVVSVYRILTRGTLEEKIMNLQRFKVHDVQQHGDGDVVWDWPMVRGTRPMCTLAGCH